MSWSEAYLAKRTPLHESYHRISLTFTLTQCIQEKQICLQQMIQLKAYYFLHLQIIISSEEWKTYSITSIIQLLTEISKELSLSSDYFKPVVEITHSSVTIGSYKTDHNRLPVTLTPINDETLPILSETMTSIPTKQPNYYITLQLPLEYIQRKDLQQLLQCNSYIKCIIFMITSSYFPLTTQHYEQFVAHFRDLQILFLPISLQEQKKSEDQASNTQELTSKPLVNTQETQDGIRILIENPEKNQQINLENNKIQSNETLDETSSSSFGTTIPSMINFSQLNTMVAMDTLCWGINGLTSHNEIDKFLLNYASQLYLQYIILPSASSTSSSSSVVASTMLQGNYQTMTIELIQHFGYTPWIMIPQDCLITWYDASNSSDESSTPSSSQIPSLYYELADNYHISIVTLILRYLLHLGTIFSVPGHVFSLQNQSNSQEKTKNITKNQILYQEYIARLLHPFVYRKEYLSSNRIVSLILSSEDIESIQNISEEYEMMEEESHVQSYSNQLPSQHAFMIYHASQNPKPLLLPPIPPISPNDIFAKINLQPLQSKLLD